MFPLSRRSVLLGASSYLALTELAQLRDAAAATSLVPAQAAGGRINLGLGSPTVYSFFHPFINAWKISSPMTIIVDVGKGRPPESWNTRTPPGQPKSPWGVFLDDDGELVRPLPSNFRIINRIIYTGPVGPGSPEKEQMPGFTRVGERWVVKWDGGPAKAGLIGGGVSSSQQHGNRLEWTWSADSNHHKTVFFEGVDRNNPPRNIRVCEARLEARLDAGEIFNPDWLAQIANASGVVRFMDWSVINHHYTTRRFADIPSERHYRWGGESATEPGVRVGMPLTVMTKLVEATRAHAWVCVPHSFGMEKVFQVKNVGNSNPAVITAPGHNFVDGEPVLLSLTAPAPLVNVLHTVSNANSERGTFELKGVNSTAMASGGVGIAHSKYDLSRIEREVAPLAAHFRDHMPPDRITFFELSNETWNAMFSQHAFYGHQGTASGMLGFRSNPNKMAGYIAAHIMRVVRETYGPDKRSRWRGVLPTQTVSTGVTALYLEGIKYYLRTQAPGLTVRDLFDDVAVTGYWGGHFFNLEAGAGTITLGSPAHIQWAYPQQNGFPIKFSTTGALPGGITANTVYWVVNSRYPRTGFQIAATRGGPPIAATGTQSGAHTITSALFDVARQWMDDSTARWQQGLEPTKYTYFDRIANEDNLDGRHSSQPFSLVGVKKYWELQKAIADANGLGFVQYEGGNHSILHPTLHQDAQFMEFYPKCHHTAADAVNHKAMFELFTAMGGRFPCKYGDFGPVSKYGAFAGLRWMSGTAMDSNPVWDAVVAFNNGR